MKNATLVACGILLAHVSYGQKTEYSAHFTSGGAAFRGASAQSESFINVSSIDASSYTNNPYGKRPGFSYGLAGQAQRVTGKHNLWGAQAGYEVLQSRVKIIGVFERSDAGTPATGHTTLASQFINVHPFFGHRFALPAVDLDVTAGPEIGFLQDSREKTAAKTTGREFAYHRNRNLPITTDLRARVNVAAYYHQFGLTAGYSYGFSNYRQNYVGGSTNELYTQVFRLGAAYRFN